MSRVCVLIPQPPSDCIVSLVALNAAEPEGEVGRLCFDTVEKQALFFLILFLRVPLCSLSPPCAQSCRHALRSGSFHVAESAHMHRPPISSEDLQQWRLFQNIVWLLFQYTLGKCWIMGLFMWHLLRLAHILCAIKYL